MNSPYMILESADPVLIKKFHEAISANFDSAKFMVTDPDELGNQKVQLFSYSSEKEECLLNRIESFRSGFIACLMLLLV